MDWITFYSNNLGFEFKDKSKPGIIGKLYLFNKYDSEKDSLQKLCENSHELYERIDKKFYKTIMTNIKK
jgi:hypothetical protein